MCHHRRRCHGGCNAPQPYGAYNPPAPYGGYNPPAPYGGYNAPQPYGFHDRRGCHGRRRHGGPISALFHLAMPLITGNSQQQREQPQMQQQQRDFNDERPQNADYYGNRSSSNLAPQDFGYTATRDIPTEAATQKAPTTSARPTKTTQEYTSSTTALPVPPNDAPPAYEASPSTTREISLRPNEKSGLDRPSSSSSSSASAPVPAYTLSTDAQLPQQRSQQQGALEPNNSSSSSWWAGAAAKKTQRKEEKVRAKLERKAEKRGY